MKQFIGDEDSDESCRFFPDLDIDPAISGLPLPENPTVTHRMVNIPSAEEISVVEGATPQEGSDSNVQISQYYETITSSKNGLEEAKNELFNQDTSREELD